MAKQKSSRKPRKATKTTSTAKKQAKGLGDTVETVLEKTGVAKVAKWILGEDCGCDRRRDILNEMFPYQQPNCLLEEEYKYLDEYFIAGRNSITPRVQRKMLEIYNRVFNDNKSSTNCSSCFLNGVHSKLQKVYNQYKEENEETN